MAVAIPSPSDSPSGRASEADVGCASRDASVELALGPPCEQAAAAVTMPEEGAVTVAAKSETEPSVSSGTVAESRTKLAKSVDHAPRSSGQGLHSVKSRSLSASTFNYPARPYLASSRPSTPKNWIVSPSTATRLAAARTPVCGTLSQPIRCCGPTVALNSPRWPMRYVPCSPLQPSEPLHVPSGRRTSTGASGRDVCNDVTPAICSGRHVPETD